jgi:hypothetical protein
MKRKLIEFDVFERIKKDSLSTAERELAESTQYLAKTLGLDGLEIDCYGPENVVFESSDGTYLHANYKINNGFIEFDNLEQLVITEESEKSKSKEVLSKMLDCIIESKDQEADELFGEWLGLPGSKKIFNEVRQRRRVPIRKNGKMTGKYRIAWWNAGTPHRRQKASVVRSRMKGKVKAGKLRGASKKKAYAANRKRLNVGHMMKEWHMISENVMDYVNYCQYGTVVKESYVNHDENHNIVSVKIPTIKVRNEAKMLQFNWKTMNTDVMVKRNQAKKLYENEKFAKEVAEIKRFNALSDDKSLEEAFQNAATNWPQVLYVTQKELSNQVKLALEATNATNYDDATCEFIAEGLLRTAHETFVDRVAKILKLAGSKVNEGANDKYAEFANVVENYYKTLDESSSLEMQAFVDLYEALRNVYEVAKEEENQEMAVETASHLDDLLSIIKQESEPSLEVAENAASWLYDVVEANLEGMEWETNEPVVSATGDHPMVRQHAKKSYSPASDLGSDCGDAQMTSDGKETHGSAAEELANSGFSNEGGEGVYPNLDNPYILKNADYKIHGEKDIDSDSDQLAHVGGNDTWPNLQNPYVKNADVSKE